MQLAIVLCLAVFVVAVSAYTKPLDLYTIQEIHHRALIDPNTAVGPVREKRSLLLGAAGLAGAGLLGAGLLGAGVAGAGLAGAGLAGAGLAGAGLGLAAGLVKHHMEHFTVKTLYSTEAFLNSYSKNVLVIYLVVCSIGTALDRLAAVMVTVAVTEEVLDTEAVGDMEAAGAGKTSYFFFG